MARGNIAKRPDGKWRARYRDDDGIEHSKHFARKTDASAWLIAQTAAVQSGAHVSPRHDKLTVGDWCDEWLEHYSPPSASTKAQARVNIARIKDGLGHYPLRNLKPMHTEKWLGDLRTRSSAKGKPLAQSTVHATYRTLTQVLAAAARNGRLASVEKVLPPKGPPQGAQVPYVAEKEHVEALAALFPGSLELAVWLAAYGGMRDGELCGMRPADVNPLKAELTPSVQYPDKPLKTDASKATVPIPRWLADKVAAHIEAGYSSKTHLFVNEWGDQVAPWVLQRAMRKARRQVAGLPKTFRLHDLRHYYASVLIAEGLDIKTVSVRMRHSNPNVTLRTYAHLFAAANDKTRDALDKYAPQPRQRSAEA